MQQFNVLPLELPLYCPWQRYIGLLLRATVTNQYVLSRQVLEEGVREDRDAGGQPVHPAVRHQGLEGRVPGVAASAGLLRLRHLASDLRPGDQLVLDLWPGLYNLMGFFSTVTEKK